jgi:hypothetical protein
LQLEDRIVRRLHKLRRKRNISDYERPGMVTEQEAQEMVELAKLIRQQVEERLRKNHKELAREI